MEAHDLWTRHAGRVTFVEFHLAVPSDMRVGEARDICDRVEAALREEVGEVRVTIHVEPEEKAKHRGACWCCRDPADRGTADARGCVPSAGPRVAASVRPSGRGPRA